MQTSSIVLLLSINYAVINNNIIEGSWVVSAVARIFMLHYAAYKQDYVLCTISLTTHNVEITSGSLYFSIAVLLKGDRKYKTKTTYLNLLTNYKNFSVFRKSQLEVRALNPSKDCLI